MRKLFPSLFLFCFSFALLASCSKDEAAPQSDDIWKISSTLSGANEVPPNSSTATGTVTGTYNATTNSLNYNVSWTGLSAAATAGHFHAPALAGANASPLVFFLLQNNGTSGTAVGSATLSEAQEADLLAGKFYANIHAPAPYAGGEIRGQVALSR
jgi:hypothetical protein